MPNTCKHPKKKSAVVSGQLNQYARNISEHVIETYGGSYQTYEELGDSWRTCFAYSQEIENYALRETKLYIRMLDLRNGMAKDPNFLYPLIDLISQYLAEYTVRKNPNQTKEAEYERLQQLLWDENQYIRKLLMHQAAKRYSVQTPPRRKRKNNDKNVVARAINNYKIEQNVLYEYVKVSIYTKKK